MRSPGEAATVVDTANHPKPKDSVTTQANEARAET
jgi:hypothetical protein